MDLQPLLWSQGKTLVSLHRGTLHFHYFHVYSAWMQRLRSFQGLLQLRACTLSLKELEWDFFITHLNRPTCHSTLLFLKYMNISMNTVVCNSYCTRWAFLLNKADSTFHTLVADHSLQLQQGFKIWTVKDTEWITVCFANPVALV